MIFLDFQITGGYLYQLTAMKKLPLKHQSKGTESRLSADGHGWTNADNLLSV
jgi:hypothetical protein